MINYIIMLHNTRNAGSFYDLEILPSVAAFLSNKNWISIIILHALYLKLPLQLLLVINALITMWFINNRSHFTYEIQQLLLIV